MIASGGLEFQDHLLPQDAKGSINAIVGGTMAWVQHSTDDGVRYAKRLGQVCSTHVTGVQRHHQGRLCRHVNGEMDKVVSMFRGTWFRHRFMVQDARRDAFGQGILRLKKGFFDGGAGSMTKWHIPE